MKALGVLPFSRAELLFSIKSFGAAMLALYVASRAGLPRPFWAVLTTYVVAQPLAGTVRSKALFRVCGTAIGAMATVLLVPPLSNAPELLVLALALWVGVCLYLSLQDRSARSYVFMLAGYTAALIGFPAVETPQLVFELAVTRIEEIGIGILCATAVHSLVLPVGLAPTLLGQVDRVLGDAGRWFSDLLAPTAKPAEATFALRADRQRLAGDLTALRLLSVHLPFDTGRLRFSVGTVGALQDAMAEMTTLLAAVEDCLEALIEAEGRIAPDVELALAEASHWLSNDWAKAAPAARAAAAEPAAVAALASLQAALRTLGDTAPSPQDGNARDSDWRRGLRIGLAVRLDDLVHGWQRCEALRRGIDAGLGGAASRAQRAPRLDHRVMHRDPGMALRSAVAAVLAICLCSAIWILTAWPSGAAAAMMAAVFCCFFATLDDPSPSIHQFLRFTLYSLPISLVYVLLLPGVQDFGALALLCAPSLLVLGALTARPATAVAGLVMAFGVLGTLALHDTGNVDMPSFINSNLGQVVGIMAAALVTRLVRSVGADRSASRIRRAVQRELGKLAAAPRAEAAHAAYAVRMLDRIALLLPRLALVDPALRDEATAAVLRDLRTGTDIVALQEARPTVPALASLLRDIARHLRHVPDPTLPSRVEALLSGLLATGAGRFGDDRRAIAALVGLRRSLWPVSAAVAQ